MTRDEFVAAVRKRQPTDLATEYLASEAVTVFPDAGDYAQFKARVRKCVSGVESVSIVGTGNWRFSLNPDKRLKEFDKASDIDVAVISYEQFTQTWEELRRIHRSRWYALPHEERMRIRRNGENVYAGFITPAWIPKIPGHTCPITYRFRTTLNNLRDKSVDFKPVRMLFFKNLVEAIDYYERGFFNLKRKVEKNEI